ncbi:MAG: LysR family transcriptional regulator [Deltaproteobacteria bacterium]
MAKPNLQPAKTGLITRGLKLNHLRLVVALARSGQISQAADELGLTQPAASRLTAEISRIVGHQVHRRTGKGIALTPAGLALAERARRALIEIGDAARDLDEGASGNSGQVRIGSVTGPSIEYILPILRDVRRESPSVSIDVEVAPSDVLGDMLLEGKLDFSLSRYPNDRDPTLFHGIPIGDEPISIIVRRGHPLLGPRKVALADMLAFDWVLPAEGAILRRTVARVMHAAGLPAPTAGVVTSSFLLTLGVIKETDALAPVATSVARYLLTSQSDIAILQTEAIFSVDTYMLLTRRGQLQTPAAAMVMGRMRNIFGI